MNIQRKWIKQIKQSNAMWYKQFDTEMSNPNRSQGTDYYWRVQAGGTCFFLKKDFQPTQGCSIVLKESGKDCQWFSVLICPLIAVQNSTPSIPTPTNENNLNIKWCYPFRASHQSCHDCIVFYVVDFKVCRIFLPEQNIVANNHSNRIICWNGSGKVK